MGTSNKFFLLVLLLSVTAFQACLKSQHTSRPIDNSPGAYTSSILIGGLDRTFFLHIPSSYDKAKQTPLVIALHGGGGTGKGMEKLTLGGLNTLADREGFLVVYPDGIEKNWNDGRELKENRAMRENIDDVGFISTLIDSLAQRFYIDRRRVYVAGISNGGHMAQRLACERSDRIAAIGVVAAPISERLSSHCKPERPISVLFMHGTEDSLTPWDGGEIKFLFRKRGKVVSMSETVKMWVSFNNCFSSPIITTEPDKNPDDGTLVRCEVYAGGNDEAEVILYAIEGGGHTWPGGWQYLPEWIVGKTSRDIDANEILWKFFKKHAR